MKDYDCGSIPRPQRPAFCIFMQLFIVDLSFEKSSQIFNVFPTFTPTLNLVILIMYGKK